MTTRNVYFGKSTILLFGVQSLVSGLGWLRWKALSRPDIAYLPEISHVKWITYNSHLQGMSPPGVDLATTFKRTFTLTNQPRYAVLRVAGFRYYSLSINGLEPQVQSQRGKNWKQLDEFEISKEIRNGENTILVTVNNTSGMPALWFSLDADGFKLSSDELWTASYGGATSDYARLASSTVPPKQGNPMYGGEQPYKSLQQHWITILCFGAISTFTCFFFTKWVQKSWVLAGKNGISRFDIIVIAGLTGVWLALFLNNIDVLPRENGFDADGHLGYIRYIQENKSLPPSDLDWETFQPPFYYAVSSIILEVLSIPVAMPEGIMVLRLMGIVIGIGHCVIVLLTLRLLFPICQSKRLIGVVLAACLPPMLYLSQNATNEVLCATLVSATIYLCLRAVTQENVSWRLFATLGACLVAGILTKITATIILPLIAVALGWRAIQLRRRCHPQSKSFIGRAVLVLVICGLVIGWCYTRHTRESFRGGDFLIWQDDGYRTSQFYLSFGRVLQRPWYGSLMSFGDGMYSTLWGDGLFGGAVDFSTRPPWNYQLMAVAYWMALLPNLLVIVGAFTAIRKFISNPTPEWFLLLGAGFLIMFALLDRSLIIPNNHSVKAFYGLSALCAFCACAAVGFQTLSCGKPLLRMVLGILFGVWALTSVSSFRIDRSSLQVLLARARSLSTQGQHSEAADILKKHLLNQPHSSDVRVLLAAILNNIGESDEASRQTEMAVEEDPNNIDSRVMFADLLAKRGRVEESIEFAFKTLGLAPGNGLAYQNLGVMLLGRSRNDEAVRVSREGIAVDPFNSVLHFTLGSALARSDVTSEVIDQLWLAVKLKPDWPEARAKLASVLVRRGNLDEAATQYVEALKLNNADPELHTAFGEVLARQGKQDDAISEMFEALRLQPANSIAHHQLGVIYESRQQIALAINYYSQALIYDSNSVATLNNLAWIRAANQEPTYRDGAEAVRLAERACVISGFKEALLVGTLAVAYAETGRFDDAVALAKNAHKLALENDQVELAAKNQALVQMFSLKHSYQDFLKKRQLD